MTLAFTQLFRSSSLWNVIRVAVPSHCTEIAREVHSSHGRAEQLAVFCIRENGTFSNQAVTCGVICGLEAIIGLEAIWRLSSP